MMLQPYRGQEVRVLVRQVLRTIVGLCCFTTVTFACVQAAPMQSLAAMAHKYDYTYMMRDPENSVELFKPGTDIVVQPGSRLYWVNGTPSSLQVAPVFHNRDVFVSQEFVDDLKRLALADPPADPSSAHASVPIGSGNVTVTAAPTRGRETLDVSGSAPGNSPVKISLYATISRDLPILFLSATDTVATSAGAYSAVVSIDPDYFRGSLITVKVSVPNGNVASTDYVVGAPNPGAVFPAADSIGGP